MMAIMNNYNSVVTARSRGWVEVGEGIWRIYVNEIKLNKIKWGEKQTVHKVSENYNWLL